MKYHTDRIFHMNIACLIIVVICAVSGYLYWADNSKGNTFSKEELLTIKNILEKTPIADYGSCTADQIAEKAFLNYHVSYKTMQNSDEVEAVFSGYVKTDQTGSSAKAAYLSFIVNIRNESVRIGTAAGGLDWSSLIEA